MDDNIHVLLAEDDRNLGNILKSYLEAKGYPTRLCVNGEETLEAYKRERFDFCILDVMMPVKDGFTVAKEIRGMNKDIPILFLTAKSLQEDVLKEVERYFPVDPGEPGVGKDLLKILVLPGLPTAEPFKSESVRLLKEKGVDAILSFRSILIDLVNRVEVNKSYRKSDTLQVLRLLKNYDLLQDTQLDLFKR